MRKHPAPPNKGSIVSAGEGGSKRGGARGAGIGAKSNRNEEDALCVGGGGGAGLDETGWCER